MYLPTLPTMQCIIAGATQHCTSAAPCQTITMQTSSHNPWSLTRRTGCCLLREHFILLAQ